MGAVLISAASTPGIGGAWLAFAGMVAVAIIGGVLARRPRRSLAFEEMDAAIKTQAGLIDRQDARISNLEASNTALHAEVEACHKERDSDRRRFEARLTEMQETIRGLLRREGGSGA